MFRARIPPNFITSHKIPRLPGNLHFVTTSRSLANAIRKKAQHDTSEMLRLPRNMKMDTSKVLRLPRKNATHVVKTSQWYCAYHAKRFSTRQQTRPHVTKCHACYAKRSYVTRKTSKNDPSWKTSHRHGHAVLTQTVANGPRPPE